MPLAPPVSRTPLHRRRIEVTGYQRCDGRWEIDAHLVDTKTHVYANAWRGEVPAGEAVHDMWLRLTLDDEFTVCAIEAVSDRNPYPPCREAVGNFQQLHGLKIGPGWQRAVKERVGGPAGCTHLRELLGPIASVAFQTILQHRYEQGAFRRQPRPGLIDSCYAYRREGEVIRHLWPDASSGQ